MTISLRRAAFALALCGSMPLVAPPCIVPAHAQNATEKVNISAVVRDDVGAPVEGADVVVVLRGEDEDNQYIELKTDAQGRFATRQNKAKWGTEIFVHAPGYAVRRVYFVPDENNEFRLKPGVSMTGKVIDKAGQPVANAKVTTKYLGLSAEDEPRAYLRFVQLEALPETLALKRAMQAVSGADGTWKIDDLPAESQVDMELLDPRFERAVAQVILGATTGNVPDLVATPGATLKGRVVTPDGKPLANAVINANVGKGRGSYAQTKSAADGTFTLFSLKSGAAEIKVASPLPELAPTSVKGIEVKANETTTAPEIRLGAGVLLTGKVIDKETKAPLADASVMAQGDFGNTASAKTGKDGIYRVRVPTGQVRFYVYARPTDYLHEMFADSNLNIGENSTKAPDFVLQRGLTLTGTAVDETGAPATGAPIIAGDRFDGAQTVVDAEGKWEIRGVDPGPSGRRATGKGELKSADEWQIVKGGNISLRENGPIALTLQRIELEDVTLRVVTPDGEPIADAKVRAAILFDTNGATRFEEVVTNARGEATIKKLRPNESVELSPEKAGYALQKAGVIPALTGAQTRRATDAILTPKNGTLRGRILDAAGAPVAGARVAVLWPGDVRDSKELAASDAQGRFELENLSAGELLVGAGRGREWGQTETRTGGEVEIKLAPATPQPVPGNRALTRDLIQQWFDETGQKSNSNLAEYAAIVASVKPAEAAQYRSIVGEGNYRWFDAALARRLAKSDPAMAITAARAAVDEPKKPDEHEKALLNLATILVNNGDLKGAREIYDSVAPTVTVDARVVDPQKSLWDTYRFAQLAAIAGAIGHPGADYWLELTDRSLDRMSADDRIFRFGSYAGTMAKTDVPTAIAWIDTRAPAEQIRAYEEIVPFVAARDLPRARELFAKMEALVANNEIPVEPDRNDAMYRPTPARSLNVARAAIVKALLPTDARAAYQVASKITSDGYELERLQIDAALRLPAAEALPILRAQYVEAQKQDNAAAGAMARLARLVEPLDAALSEQWFDEARAKLSDNPYRDDNTRAMAANYAFYRAQSDPAQARLLLENEWQRTVHAKAADEMDSSIYRLQSIVWAMVPIDWERALQMMREKDELLGDKQYNQVLTQRNMLMWLLADERERREMNFERPNIELFDGNP